MNRLFIVLLLNFFALSCADNGKINLGKVTEKTQSEGIKEPEPANPLISNDPLKPIIYGKVSIEKIVPVPNLATATKYTEGKKTRFFTMTTKNDEISFYKSYGINFSNGVKFNAPYPGYSIVSDELAIGDKLFYLFKADMFDLASLMSFDPEETFAESANSELFKLGESFLGVFSHMLHIFSFNNNALQTKSYRQPGENGFIASGGSQVLIAGANTAYGLMDPNSTVMAEWATQNGLWRISEDSLEPKEIKFSWGGNKVKIISLTFDKISQSFILQHQLLDKDEKSIDGQWISRYTRIDSSGKTTELGRGDTLDLLNGTIVGDVFFVSGKKFKKYKNKDYSKLESWENANLKAELMVLKNNKFTTLPIEGKSFEFLKVDDRVYAHDAGSIYKLGLNGTAQKLTNNVKISPESRYFKSQGFIYLQAENLYLINKETGSAQKIELPNNVKSFESLELCDQSYVLMKDANKFLGIYELVNGKLKEIKEIPRTLRNVRKIPGQEHMFLIAGQGEKVDWYAWKFSCQKN